MGSIELFQASTHIRRAGRVPDVDDSQIRAARERFLQAIRAESTPPRTIDEPAA